MSHHDSKCNHFGSFVQRMTLDRRLARALAREVLEPAVEAALARPGEGLGSAAAIKDVNFRQSSAAHFAEDAARRVCLMREIQYTLK